MNFQGSNGHPVGENKPYLRASGFTSLTSLMVLYHIVFWSHVISNNFVVALGYWICSFMSMIFHALDRNFAFDGTRSTVIVTL